MALTLTACQSERGKVAPPTTPADDGGQTVWLTGRGFRLKSRIYRSPEQSEHPALVVVLHGDSPFGPPSYQYAFSRNAAGHLENAIVAGLLRPGYHDGTGDRSDGIRGRTTGDNYTPTVVDATGEVVEKLRQQLHAGPVILVGHSGGAAISADLLGRWPRLASAALLVSCPCDVPKWRRHMLGLQHNPIWLFPVSSINPIELADKVPATAQVSLITGDRDNVAPSQITYDYAGELKRRIPGVSVVTLPGLQHDILLEPGVLRELQELLGRVEKRP